MKVSAAISLHEQGFLHTMAVRTQDTDALIGEFKAVTDGVVSHQSLLPEGYETFQVWLDFLLTYTGLPAWEKLV